MKRSEMLYKLTELMRDNYQAFEDYAEGRLNFNQLETIVTNMFLTEVELAGMLPPQIMKKDPGHFPGDAFEYTMNEWEEND